MEENVKKIVISMEAEQVQMQISKTMWKQWLQIKRIRGLQLFMKIMFCVFIVVSLAFAIPLGYMAIKGLILISKLPFVESDIVLTFVKSLIVSVVFIVLAVLSAIQFKTFTKIWEKNYWRKIKKMSRKIREKEGVTQIEYELTEEYIRSKSDSKESTRQWNEIKGCFCEDGWTGLLAFQENKPVFVMLNHALLSEEEMNLLNNLVAEKVEQKEIDWEYIHSRKKWGKK